MEDPSGYVSFIAPQNYVLKDRKIFKSPQYLSVRVLFFNIPYKNNKVHGKFYTSNETNKPINSAQLHLGMMGNVMDTQDYFNHIMSGTDVPADYIVRVDGSDFEKSEELIEFRYSNPGSFSRDNTFWLQGTVENPELVANCTVHIDGGCTSWASLPDSDIQDRIEVKYAEEFAATGKTLTELLDYTEKTFACMRSEV